MKNISDIFKKKPVDSVEYYIHNDECRKLVDEIRRVEMENIGRIIIIWEDPKRQTFWKSAGCEPAQAILTLDQLHHRIQHEGLPGYD